MLKDPRRASFPGRAKGNGIAEDPGRVAEPDQDQRLHVVSPLGNKRTRTMPKEFGEFKIPPKRGSGASLGQAMTQMINVDRRSTPSERSELFADWTDRIAAGELPFSKPPRPQGVERNVVVTLWDWSDAHGLPARPDRDRPAQAHGQRQRPIYGAPENSTDYLPVLDPVRTPRRRSSIRCAIQRRRTRHREARWRRRPSGDRSRSGTARPASTTR